ncbi:MAG TPA: AI-2E family transporter, partial [Stellaceae bacterium]|nr:AI-2E family transporter [Stellaceae bacterium]
VHAFLLLGIFTLLLLDALYFAAHMLLPVMFAFLLQLLLQPVMRALGKLHIPKTAAALLVLLALLGALGMLGSSLAGPASGWIAKAPESLPRLEQRLSAFRAPIDKVQKATKEVEQMAAGPAAAPEVVVKGPALGALLLSGTRSFLIGLGTTIVLLFFLLISGDLFLRRLVEILPNFRDKKQAVEISHEIERNISAYLMTISLMNAAVGIATGIETYLCGLADPILWGTLAFVLNYVIIIGPLTGMAVLFLAGLLTFDTMWQALLPAGIYLVIHLVEGESITPMLLARRFTLNPVLVILSLIFWYWMWGVAGALLAVPMLATFKIIADRIRPLMALGHFLGVEPRVPAPDQSA